jgi:hypothetical protein
MLRWEIFDDYETRFATSPHGSSFQMVCLSSLTVLASLDAPYALILEYRFLLLAISISLKLFHGRAYWYIQRLLLCMC